MNLARRTLFQFAGGSAAGVLFTPIPWRLMWDSAVWTQNWSLIPKLPHGEIRTKFTNCTLCPASCPMKVRCIGDQPVSLTGVAATAESNGALCPVGLAAHHLPYHPKRAVKPFRRSRPDGNVTAAPLTERLKALPAGQSTVILDERPGRVTSALYEKFAKTLPAGVYVTSPQLEGGTLAALESLTGAPAALSLAEASLVLSIGTPLLDGWGTPGRIFQARQHFRLIQVEPVLTRTASAADRWIPIRPGTEAAFALGLIHVLAAAKEKSGLARAAAEWTPERTQAVTGIPAAEIVRTAQELAAAKGALVIADGDPGGGPFSLEEQQLFAALNLMVPNALRKGGVSHRRKSIDTLADGSI
ncbi:MAG: molybdopterin-dependent oxidoreductase, partial [Acidobacteria bacterium]|nr:molybdopterin-dependent oxidoreductase [Acidobacteriota bacterium]